MGRLTALKVVLAAALVPVCAGAEGFVFSSPTQRVHLVELYTSEGCSSCPPADRWLSRLKEDGRLWTGVVPVAFHVDYWDRLGWDDPFAAPSHSQRQRQYASVWKERNAVYTPGFVVDGQEWKGFFRGQELLFEGNELVGQLVLEVGLDGGVRGRFEPPRAVGPLELHVALLGCGLTSGVRAGENRGRTLSHDFVVLEHQRVTSQGVGPFEWATKLSLGRTAPRRALAAWVTRVGQLAPLQAVGGWLESKEAPLKPF